MGRKSRYSGYLNGMNKKDGSKNVTTKKKKSIKNKLHKLMDQSKKGDK